MEVMQKDTMPVPTIQEFVKELADPSNLEKLEFVANVAMWSDGSVRTTVLGEVSSRTVLPYIDDVRDVISSGNPLEDRAGYIGESGAVPRCMNGADLLAPLVGLAPPEKLDEITERFLLDFEFLVQEARSAVEADYCWEYLALYHLDIKFTDGVFGSNPKLNDRLLARLDYLTDVRVLEKKQADQEPVQLH
jgi:hypothetical protein